MIDNRLMHVMFIFLLFLSTSIEVYSQDKGKIYGKVIYKYKFNFPTSVKDTLKSDLYFDNAGHSFYVEQLITTQTKTSNFGTDNQSPSVNKFSDSLIVFRSASSNEQISMLPGFIKRYLVSDTIKRYNWTLLETEKIIGKFFCRSAKGKVAGREYIVWYTPEIPISTGPWKFYGLPGLILEVRDIDGLISYQVSSIEISKNKNNDFNITNWKKKAISRIEFEKKSKEDIDKLKAIGESRGVRVELRVSSRGLELEY